MNEGDKFPVEVIRSKKRRKTVSGEVRNGVLLVRVPHKLSDAELATVIDKFQTRLARRAGKRRQQQSDEVLAQIARDFNKRYFDGRLQWESIRYVTNQNSRFGSCTPMNGTIRISHRLAMMPPFVLRYVVMHELAHLEEANHGPDFWALVNLYPLTERARGYLMAIDLEEISDA